MSLVNDTVATLAACRYQDKDSMMGVILGTGCNGAYVETSEHVHNTTKQLPQGTEMIINCEWGNFSSEALPMIDEDKCIDAASENPENQHFEKMTAGMVSVYTYRHNRQALAEFRSYCLCDMSCQSRADLHVLFQTVALCNASSWWLLCSNPVTMKLVTISNVCNV